jgi:hypothetical protein
MSMGGLTPTRRAGAAALAMLCAGGAALSTAAPAGAAVPTPVITLTTLAPTALTPGEPAFLGPFIYSYSGSKPIDTPATVTIDFHGLAKVAKVTLQGNCTVKNSVATCKDTLQSVGRPSEHTAAVRTTLTLTPLKGAPLGAQGSFTIAGRAAGVRFANATSTATIGGPSFKLAPLSNRTGLRVGTTVAEPIQFTNVGDRPSAGSEVVFEVTPGLTFAQHFRNCAYGSMAGSGFTAAVCRFGGTVRLGETLALAAPEALRVNSHALYTAMYAYVLPENAPVSRVVGPAFAWRSGAGPLLGLRVLAPGRATASPVGTVATNLNNLYVELDARNTADFGVWGAAAEGNIGSVVQVNVGIYNHGPADLANDSPPNLQFSLPPGVTAVGIPAACGLEDAAVAGVYACGFGWSQSFDIPSGTRLGFTFSLRINKLIKHATGTVSLWGPPMPYDPNPKNNAAAVTIN